ncbi:MAG TPA: GNAT family N-acetyltransferase [Candidatus Bathyarchaeia archaeon]|nr:GNAT family N-acetyltransferase [Candidatus Bathyarchaeia archaeon]
MIAVKVQLAQKNNCQKVSKLLKILDTENYFFSNPKDIDQYINKKQCYIAIQNKQIIGTLILRQEDQSYEIYLLVSKEKGGGRALIEFAVKKCKQDKILKLWCWSLSRYQAKGFYQKLGFKESFLLKKQWYGEDCYFFGRVIDLK